MDIWRWRLLPLALRRWPSVSWYAKLLSQNLVTSFTYCRCQAFLLEFSSILSRSRWCRRSPGSLLAVQTVGDTLVVNVQSSMKFQYMMCCAMVSDVSIMSSNVPPWPGLLKVVSDNAHDVTIQSVGISRIWRPRPFVNSMPHSPAFALTPRPFEEVQFCSKVSYFFFWNGALAHVCNSVTRHPHESALGGVVLSDDSDYIRYYRTTRSLFRSCSQMISSWILKVVQRPAPVELALDNLILAVSIRQNWGNCSGWWFVQRRDTLGIVFTVTPDLDPYNEPVGDRSRNTWNIGRRRMVFQFAAYSADLFVPPLKDLLHDVRLAGR